MNASASEPVELIQADLFDPAQVEAAVRLCETSKRW